MLAKIESILFVASKPLGIKTIAKAVGVRIDDVVFCLDTLREKYHGDDSGIVLLQEGDMVQMGTNPMCADMVEQFVKNEASGELTKAQLETLTVVAYRGPVSRAELEQIRGVNCAIILRNLLMRGLITEEESDEHVLPVYRISIDTLRELGISSATDLPEYEQLRAHEHIERIVSERDPSFLNEETL